MPHSTSAKPNGIVLDTNVLSLLAASGKLSLLQELVFQPICITASIHGELLVGLERSARNLSDAIALIESKVVQVLNLTQSEQKIQIDFPDKLAKGEADAIAICRERNMLFITRDRKAANFCDREGIECIRFRLLLRQFHEAGHLTEEEMDSILK